MDFENRDIPDSVAERDGFELSGELGGMTSDDRFEVQRKFLSMPLTNRISSRRRCSRAGAVTFYPSSAQPEGAARTADSQRDPS
jgi:hypothetical protein